MYKGAHNYIWLNGNFAHYGADIILWILLLSADPRLCLHLYMLHKIFVKVLIFCCKGSVFVAYLDSYISGLTKDIICFGFKLTRECSSPKTLKLYQLNPLIRWWFNVKCDLNHATFYCYIDHILMEEMSKTGSLDLKITLKTKTLLSVNAKIWSLARFSPTGNIIMINDWTLT